MPSWTRQLLFGIGIGLFSAGPASADIRLVESGSEGTPESEAHEIGQPFSFEFFSSDVGLWARGQKSGPVRDFEDKMAAGLHRFMRGAKENLKLALYGVQNQSWFLSRLRSLVHGGIGVGAVVDQSAGTVGEWVPENFTYSDTVRLPGIVGEEATTPDQDPDGGVRTGTIMHNKFVVRDDTAVWVGSANLSSTCLGDEYNANTALVIKSEAVAGIYAGEFEQMAAERRFSVHKRQRPDRQPLRFSDGTEVRIYFSPQDNTLETAILPFIAAARKTLDIGLFFLTDIRVADALAAAVKRGVKVRVIYDALAAANPHSLHKTLRKSGVEVKVENWGGKMHMKDAVADGKHVILGSMNWSGSGSAQNDENTLVIRNNPELAGKDQRYFEYLWQLIPAADGADPRAESPDSINSCQDGVDNDHDGYVDAQDGGCKS